MDVPRSENLEVGKGAFKMRVSEMSSMVVFLALDDSIDVDEKALFQERFEKVCSSAGEHRGSEKSEENFCSTFFPNHHHQNSTSITPSSMTSIIDCLSPDLLFNIFKRLDCIETTRIRRVCKQWFEIIDEYQSFWRTLHLPENRSRQDLQSLRILRLFDQKSGSTLQDVAVGVKGKKKHRVQVYSTLKKSKETLKQVVLILDYLDVEFSSKFIPVFINVESLRVTSRQRLCKVRLRRTSFKRDSQEDESNAASPLRVLWCQPGRSILEIDNARFENLISLDAGAALSASEWRGFFSRNLMHLRLGFKNDRHEDHTEVLALGFPKLEVLELDSLGDFPRWLLIPDTVKLIAHSNGYNLPSISGLWTWDPLSNRDDVVSRLPELETLCLGCVYVLESVVEMLNGRKANVEAGLQVDGVKMEMIKTLILPFSQSDPNLSDQLDQFLKKCSELVDVVEGNAHSTFIEVEY